MNRTYLITIILTLLVGSVNVSGQTLIKSKKEGKTASLIEKKKSYFDSRDIELNGYFSKEDYQAILSLPEIHSVDFSYAFSTSPIFINQESTVKHMIMPAKVMAIGDAVNELHLEVLEDVAKIRTENAQHKVLVKVDSLVLHKPIQLDDGVELQVGKVVWYGDQAFEVPYNLTAQSLFLFNNVTLVLNKSEKFDTILNVAEIQNNSRKPISLQADVWYSPINSFYLANGQNIDLRITNLVCNDKEPDNYKHDHVLPIEKSSKRYEILEPQSPRRTFYVEKLYVHSFKTMQNYNDILLGCNFYNSCADPEYVVRFGDGAICLFHLREYDESINVPKVVDIFPGAFRSVGQQITNLQLGNTRIRRLAPYSLINVAAKEVTLPDGMIHISPEAFYNCTTDTVFLKSRIAPIMSGPVNLGYDEEKKRDRALSDIRFIIPKGCEPNYMEEADSRRPFLLVDYNFYREAKSLWPRAIFAEDGKRIDYTFELKKQGTLAECLSEDIKKDIVIIRLKGIIDDTDLEILEQCPKLKVLDLTDCIPVKSQKQIDNDKAAAVFASMMFGYVANELNREKNVKDTFGMLSLPEKYSYEVKESIMKTLQKQALENKTTAQDLIYLPREAFLHGDRIIDIYMPQVLTNMDAIMPDRHMGLVIYPENLKDFYPDLWDKFDVVIYPTKKNN